MANANSAQAKTQFGYRRHPDQERSGANVAEHPVVVVGAGPVGLSLAIDLAQRGQRVVLLDARELAEFRVSHLEGAARIDPSHPDFDAVRVPERARVVVYCSVGWRSADIASQLRQRGVDAYNLEGGIFRWANEGHPVVRGDRRVRAVHPYDETWGRLLDAPLRVFT